MAVKLRLRRMGKKKQPSYRIVATDSRVARDGKYIEKIGHYNPVATPPDIIVDDDKALVWLNRGAIPTDTVRNILSSKGIMLRYSLMKQGLEAAKVDEEVKKWELLQIERKKRQEALKAQQEREEQKLKKEAAKDEEEAAPPAKKAAPVKEAAPVEAAVAEEAAPEAPAEKAPEVGKEESGNSESSEPANEEPATASEGSGEEPPKA